MKMKIIISFILIFSIFSKQVKALHVRSEIGSPRQLIAEYFNNRWNSSNKEFKLYKTTEMHKDDGKKPKIPYLNEEQRKKYLLRVKDGRLCKYVDKKWTPVNTTIFFTMDKEGNIYGDRLVPKGFSLVLYNVALMRLLTTQWDSVSYLDYGAVLYSLYHIVDSIKNREYLDLIPWVSLIKEYFQPGLHHPSFIAGDEAASAGEMQVVNGIIIKINNKSGHYKQGFFIFSQIVEELIKQGQIFENTVIEEIAFSPIFVEITSSKETSKVNIDSVRCHANLNIAA